jgi:antitoxin VapB
LTYPKGVPHYCRMNVHDDIAHGTTKLFKLNRSQAVRLPKAIAFPDDVTDVVIRRVGRSLVVSPPNRYWRDFFDHEPNPDFPERDQPLVQERDFG